MQQPIFRGATRPAMYFGVPMIPAVVSAGITILAVMWFRRPELIFVFLIAFFWMRYVTSKDDFYLLQLVQRSTTTTVKAKSKNRLSGVELYSGLNYFEQRQ